MESSTVSEKISSLERVVSELQEYVGCDKENSRLVYKRYFEDLPQIVIIQPANGDKITRVSIPPKASNISFRMNGEKTGICFSYKGYDFWIITKANSLLGLF